MVVVPGDDRVVPAVLDHHRDRILGNQWLEAPVIAHELTSERVRQLPDVFKGGLSEAGADADLATDLIGTRFVPPQFTFSDRMTLTHGGHELHLVHHPGPTPGAIWVEIPDEGVVRRGGEEIHLTKTEFRLLVELVSSPGRVFSREVLLERVWGYGYFGDGRLVDVHVRRLRTKVEADPANPRHVVTVRGLGYKLQA